MRTSRRVRTARRTFAPTRRPAGSRRTRTRTSRCRQTCPRTSCARSWTRGHGVAEHARNGGPPTGIEAGMRVAAIIALLLAAAAAPGETVLTVDPDAGNNTFSAVFDAALGERITAVSATVGCTLRVDETARTGRATCSVPLTAIRIDNDDTKTDHFRQWATNGKGDARQCAIELSVDRVAVPDPIEPMTPVPFSTEGTFTICGRRRDDRGAEKIGGTLT